MKIFAQNNITFQRKLKPTEELEYSKVLKLAKEKVGNTDKSILIVPASSLPNETGVGNLITDESQNFFEFAKKYWGINEILILPMGQYHEHTGVFPIYSGTTMDLGNHVIDIKNYVSNEDYQKIINNNNEKNYVNFSNIVKDDSISENILKKIHNEGKYKQEFEKYKSENISRLEPKALYRALRDIYKNHDYKKWNDIDKNLFDTNFVNETNKANRIQEIYKLKAKDIDFYYFKQFLAEDSLKRARTELNQKGLKLNGDMPCGFSFDEVWSNPNAFHKNTSIGWGLPAINFDTPEGEKLFRNKVKFYAERYDGFRVDASWIYANQPLINNGFTNHKRYDDKILNIIDEEVKKLKGANYNLNNIMHEFATTPNNFDIHNGSELKPYIASRMKLYTSDYLSDNWGSNHSFKERGWNPNLFIIGTSNHDSKKTEYSTEQVNALSKIFKLPTKKLESKSEFQKAKLAEPLSAKNNTLYFIDALNLKNQFQFNTDPTLDYRTQIPHNYQKHYFDSLENGFGFNPMDALEKNFKAKGLDKKETKLYKKIVKYKNILEGKESKYPKILKLSCGVMSAMLIICGLIKYYQIKYTKKNNQ